MKTILTTLVSILLFLLISSCSNETDFNIDGEVIIAGKILNFENNKEVRSLRIYYNTYIKIRETKKVEINDDGFFQTSIPCHNITEFSIFYIREASPTFICIPNDSLYISIDSDILNDHKNKFPNGSYFAEVTGGSRVYDNLFVNEFLRKIRKTASFSERKDTIKEYSPIDYLEYQNKLEKLKTTILDSLIQTDNTEVFRMWAKDYIKYEKLDDLLRYNWLHARYNDLIADSLNIPSEYYTQIFNENINETKVSSFRHSNFLHSYYVHLHKQAKKEDTEIPDLINIVASGFSKNIALAKYFYTLYTKSDTITNISIELIDNDYVKRLLTQAINKEQKKKAELLIAKNNTPFLDSLISKYKGKVVYIDFWATWCGPCLNEIPYSKLLQEEFKDKPVEFLFLCIQSSHKDWQKIIKEKELTGTHLLLSEEQYDEASNLFEIKGIPHHVFINKQGGFINNALSPIEKNTGNKINQLLIE